MKSSKPVLAGLLLAICVPAQSVPAQQLPAEFQELAAEWKATKASYRAAKAEVRSTAVYKAALAAPRDIDKLRALIAAVPAPDRKAFGKRALALADQVAGDARMEILAFAATNFEEADTAKIVLKRVLRDHIESERVADLLRRSRSFAGLIGAEAMSDLLAKVVASNPHPQPRVHALLLMSREALKNREATAADYERAKAQVLSADALARGTPLAKRASRARFEVENLLPGCVAPEIAGEDLEGAAFKLSDYRGKVVLLDFWGFW
ncbi:MAG: peroxiredoxin family protein [Planctomycetota bacterium]